MLVTPYERAALQRHAARLDRRALHARRTRDPAAAARAGCVRAADSLDRIVASTRSARQAHHGARRDAPYDLISLAAGSEIADDAIEGADRWAAAAAAARGVRHEVERCSAPRLAEADRPRSPSSAPVPAASRSRWPSPTRCVRPAMAPRSSSSAAARCCRGTASARANWCARRWSGRSVRLLDSTVVRIDSDHVDLQRGRLAAERPDPAGQRCRRAAPGCAHPACAGRLPDSSQVDRRTAIGLARHVCSQPAMSQRSSVRRARVRVSTRFVPDRCSRTT